MNTVDAKTLLLINNYHYRRGGADAVYLEHDALFQGAKAELNTGNGRSQLVGYIAQKSFLAFYESL